MRKSQPKSTSTAKLEKKFDAGEEVLDYFDLSGAKVITLPKESTPAPIMKPEQSSHYLHERPGEYVAKRQSIQRNETPGSKEKGELMNARSDGGEIQRRCERAGQKKETVSLNV